MIYMFYNFLIFSTLTLGLTFSPFANSSEIDSFTQRHLPLRNSANLLDQRINENLFDIVSLTNSKDLHQNKSCDRNNLYTFAKKILAAPLEGPLEREIIANPQIYDQHLPELKDSIYQDFFFLKYMKFMPFGKTGPTIAFYGLTIGADKFGHFFTEGWEYYDRVFNQKQSVEEAMSWGESKEEGFFGLGTTGVYSFADLVANFNGMRFWVHLLGDGHEVLSGAEKVAPFISCKQGRWHLDRVFYWEDYIDPTYDEGFNCSVFGSDKLTANAKKRIAAVGELNGTSIQCPLKKINEQDLIQKYERYAPRLLNFHGIRTH